MVLISYVVNTKSKGKKNVLALTTMRPLLGVTKDDDKVKPAIPKLYDYTKGGTDIVDLHIGTSGGVPVVGVRAVTCWQ